MSARKKSWIDYLIYITVLWTANTAGHASLASDTVAKQLGWVPDPTSHCGGYYLEAPFATPNTKGKKSLVEITSNHGLIAQHGTSTLEGSVTITRTGQQITANKVYLYRDPNSYKLKAAEMIGNVNLREPNTLIIGKHGHYYFETNSKSIDDVLYRTALNGKEIAGPNISTEAMQHEHRVAGLAAWGHADGISQTDAKVYELHGASFSACPPVSPAWQVKSSHLVLDKNTGRGHATHARILVKEIPVFYFPYIDFSIDHQRKTGFLWPTFGISNSSFGPNLLLPFYWNMAPNYDMTITPGILTKRGIQLTDDVRYLTETSHGKFNVSVLPSDRGFGNQQRNYRGAYGTSTDAGIQAELNRLLNSSTTRRSLSWQNDTRFDQHWSSHIDYNYAGDDYHLQDFGSTLNEITQNQLPQEANINYQSNHWNFLGRMQAYQTLHPIILGQPPVQNQYRRFPQLLINGDYPDQPFGLEYFVASELTHFDIRKTPGTTPLPIGNRLHLQPGVSLPMMWSYLYVNPRAQLALTDYQLYHTASTGTPTNIRRGIPIFDVAATVTLSRILNLFGQSYQQTLEPQAYYTYIPYRNQDDIPIFDTTVNTLTYDQLFNYNRFSGIDRIGDANQVGLGVTSRFIDERSGLEKVRVGLGEIVYFANRNTTLCNDTSCTDNPTNHSNYQRLSPVSGLVNYHINPLWSVSGNAIWNPVSKRMNNSTVGLHYQPDAARLINLTYGYVFNGDIQSGSVVNSTANNLKLTDFSLAWPVISDVSFVGRWSEDWNLSRLQNLLAGVQYDTCCWSVRFIGGRAFTQIHNNTPQYQNQFYIQFALKGLGNIGSRSPAGLLSSINGYNTQFGQEL